MSRPNQQKPYRYNPQLKSRKKYLLNYRLTTQERFRHWLNGDLANLLAWMEMAQSVFDGYNNAIHKQPIWDGHIEQFGLVMTHLSDILKTRHDHTGRFVKEWDRIFPEHGEYSWCDEPANCPIDDLLASAWFRLIGHPEFTGPNLFSTSYASGSYYEFLVAVAADDLNNKF